jgi:hypothetical protein
MSSISKSVYVLFSEDLKVKSSVSEKIKELNDLISKHYTLLSVDHALKDGKVGIVFNMKEPEIKDTPLGIYKGK